MNDNTEVVRELKKMNEFLEKIDWKLWNLHKKYIDETDNTASAEKPAQTLETKTKDLEPVVPVAKYPTIETWD